MPTALITGASSGIGAEAARAAAARGYSVALLGRRRSELESVRESLLPVIGGDHHCVPCDVTEASSVDSAIKEILAEMEVPEAVVTSAGVCHPAAIAQTTPELWDQTVAVNLTGTFLVARSAAMAITAARRTGSFVLIGSEQSLIGVPNYTAYAATKAGLVGLTRALAAELAPNIRVNLLCPGPVDTPMLHAEFALTDDPDLTRDEEIRRVPLRRIATAAETAEAAMWLLQDATYATGSLLSLDGGTTGAFAAP